MNTNSNDDAIVRSPRVLPDNADPAVDYTTAAATPGILRGSVSIDVQTRQAQRLVYGRRQTEDKQAIIGLVRFGMNMKRIWTAAGRDDPYADWALIKIEQTLNQAREAINAMRKEIESLLSNAATGIQIDIAHSLQPVRVPLQFANAYGYMGAYLIADYDQLVCTVLTARHVGLIQRGESEQRLNQCARMVRHAFSLSALWKFTLVTRADVSNNNPMAQTARKSMTILGEIPEAIINRQRRANISPEISIKGIVEELDPVEHD